MISQHRSNKTRIGTCALSRRNFGEQIPQPRSGHIHHPRASIPLHSLLLIHRPCSACAANMSTCDRLSRGILGSEAGLVLQPLEELVESRREDSAEGGTDPVDPV